jgi:valyl-tRNA synthetase
MLIQCSYLDDSISLQNVLLHGLIRDEQNRKMSKSLGNGIDPMDVIAQYGADAMRCFFMSSTTSGEDLRFSKQKIEYM